MIKNINHTDCRTTDGETVSIIDTISFLCKLLHKRNLNHKAVKEAIKDAQQDEEVWCVMQKLILTEEDVENRKLIKSVVDEIRKNKIKIEL